MGSPHEELMYTPKTAAPLLGMHVETVRQMCRTGQLRTIRNASKYAHYRIPASAIEEWKTRNAYNPAA